MNDPKQSLTELLAKVEKVETAAICEKLKAIIAFTDQFVPQMSAVPKDEFLVHIAELRRESSELLSECGKVLNNGSAQLNGIKGRCQSLKELIEFLFVLRGDEMVEQAHIAL